MELQLFPKTKQKPEANFKKIDAEPETNLRSFPFCSRIFFTWAHPILFRNEDDKLNIDKFQPLLVPDSVADDTLCEHIKHYRLFFAVIRSNIWILLYDFCITLTMSLLRVSYPIFIGFLIQYLNSKEKPLSYGLILAFSFALVTIFEQFTIAQDSFSGDRIRNRVNKSLLNLIYNKSLHATRISEGLGINALQIDSESIKNFFGQSIF